MIEPKISLNLLVPGAGKLSSQKCGKNSKRNYDVYKITIESKEPILNKKGKAKGTKKVKEVLEIRTRKPKLVSQHINICKEAYDEMLSTPTSAKLARMVTTKRGNMRRFWDTLSIHERLKHHFDQIAHDLRAVSYSYEILDD